MIPAKQPVRHIALSVMIMVMTSGLCLYFWTLINDFIAKKHPQVKMVDVFSDGPASQFKNKYMANFCCKLERHGLKVRWIFFAPDFQQEWSLYVNMCKEIPQQQNGQHSGIFTCLYARCFAIGCPMVVQDNIPALRQVMIVELHQRKLSSLPGPTVTAGEYYAVAFVQNKLLW